MSQPDPVRPVAAQSLVYRIDPANRITFVNEAWGDFARANHSEQFLREQILGVDLLGSFDDQTVRELDATMIRRVRTGKTVHFDYRCDVAEARRVFRMEIHLHPEGEVVFVSTLLREEPRVPVALLKPELARDQERFIRMCSWCQGVAVADGRWLQVEEAVDMLRLMEDPVLPRITHGMCEACHAGVIRSLGL